MSKQFGLIIPGQQKKQAVKPSVQPTKPSIFDESSNSSDSDNAPQMRPKGKPGVVSGPSLMERRVARNLQEKALAEDPTIFQYDELYDEMDTKREEAKEVKSKEPRKAKYIDHLMKHANRRKLENDLRIERQVQKEREAEGEKFKDSETFLTSTYRKKLEEMRLLEDMEKREEYLESIGDVSKQKDLGGFYRHLYEQKLGTNGALSQPKTASTTSEVAYKPIKPDAAAISKHRSYRRRHSSEDEEKPATTSPKFTGETKAAINATKGHLTNNIDADSDFSIDDSSDEKEEEEEDQENKPKSAIVNSEDAKPKTTISIPKDKETDSKLESMAKLKDGKDSADDESSSLKEIPPDVKPPVDRSYIWRKRTIGDVFDAALARYQERKLARRVRC